MGPGSSEARAWRHQSERSISSWPDLQILQKRARKTVEELTHCENPEALAKIESYFLDIKHKLYAARSKTDKVDRKLNISFVANRPKNHADEDDEYAEWDAELASRRSRFDLVHLVHPEMRIPKAWKQHEAAATLHHGKYETFLKRYRCI